MCWRRSMPAVSRSRLAEHHQRFSNRISKTQKQRPPASPRKFWNSPRRPSTATRPYALIRLALRLPHLVAKGHWPLPDEISGGRDPLKLNESAARDVVRSTTATLVAMALQSPKFDRLCAATLPAALCPVYANALLRPQRDPLRQPADISPLTRLTKLWWAARGLNQPTS